MSPLRSILRNFLIQNGYYLSRSSDIEDVRALIDSLRVASIEQDLIRIGGPGDGGYLIPDDLSDVIACFSPGVGREAKFERGLASLGVRSFMADCSVESLPEDHELFTFVKKFVGVETRGSTIRLEDWVNGQSLPEQGDLILQMDIEGAEYAVLLDCPRDLLKRFRIIIVEFHALDMLFSKKPFEIIKQAFAKLTRDFSVVHLHPNNRADILSNSGIDVPQAMEFTFYRNDRVKISQAKPSFPHALDSPNHSERPRVVLPRCWW